jgi:hypothetical protein
VILSELAHPFNGIVQRTLRAGLGAGTVLPGLCFNHADEVRSCAFVAPLLRNIVTDRKSTAGGGAKASGLSLPRHPAITEWLRESFNLSGTRTTNKDATGTVSPCGLIS